MQAWDSAQQHPQCLAGDSTTPSATQHGGSCGRGGSTTTPERSIRFDCPATGKRFPPGSDQTSQTEVHAVSVIMPLLSDHHEAGCSGRVSACPADPPPRALRSALLKLQHLLPPLYSVVTLLPRSPLRRAPSADTDLPAPVLLQVALLRAPLL